MILDRLLTYDYIIQHSLLTKLVTKVRESITVEYLVTYPLLIPSLRIYLPGVY